MRILLMTVLLLLLAGVCLAYEANDATPLTSGSVRGQISALKYDKLRNIYTFVINDEIPVETLSGQSTANASRTSRTVVKDTNKQTLSILMLRNFQAALVSGKIDAENRIYAETIIIQRGPK